MAKSSHIHLPVSYDTKDLIAFMLSVVTWPVEALRTIDHLVEVYDPNFKVCVLYDNALICKCDPSFNVESIPAEHTIYVRASTYEKAYKKRGMESFKMLLEYFYYISKSGLYDTYVKAVKSSGMER